jgi:hypothetical protein
VEVAGALTTSATKALSESLAIFSVIIFTIVVSQAQQLVVVELVVVLGDGALDL